MSQVKQYELSGRVFHGKQLAVRFKDGAKYTDRMWRKCWLAQVNAWIVIKRSYRTFDTNVSGPFLVEGRYRIRLPVEFWNEVLE
jgi:hypothetical protein